MRVRSRGYALYAPVPNGVFVALALFLDLRFKTGGVLEALHQISWQLHIRDLGGTDLNAERSHFALKSSQNTFKAEQKRRKAHH